jgi:hypothetical protein
MNAIDHWSPLRALLREFFINDVPRGVFLYVSPTKEAAQVACKTAWDFIQANERFAFLLDTDKRTIVNRETRGKLRFAASEIFELVGDNPPPLACNIDFACVGDERRRVAFLFPYLRNNPVNAGALR